MASGREDALPGPGRGSGVVGEMSGSVKPDVVIVAVLPSTQPKVSPHSYKFSFFFACFQTHFLFVLFKRFCVIPLVTI